MKGIQLNSQSGLESLDVTEPSTGVVVELDHKRGILYVHTEGRTILRVCRVSEVFVVGKVWRGGVPSSGGGVEGMGQVSMGEVDMLDAAVHHAPDQG